jgi:hypothetical protein
MLLLLCPQQESPFVYNGTEIIASPAGNETILIQYMASYTRNLILNLDFGGRGYDIL